MKLDNAGETINILDQKQLDDTQPAPGTVNSCTYCDREAKFVCNFVSRKMISCNNHICEAHAREFPFAVPTAG